MSCAIAGLHADRYEGHCDCIHCSDECDCDDLAEYDADELGLDPDEDDDFYA